MSQLAANGEKLNDANIIMDVMPMFYYVYMTTNLVNNKKYIGQHSTKNLNDGYLGSGVYFKQALQKYGRSNFKKEILGFAQNRTELDELERAYIEKYDAVNSRNFYNVCEGGFGQSLKWSPERKIRFSLQRKEMFKKGLIKIRDISGDKNPMYGMTGEKNPKFGTKMSEESREKLSKTVTAQYEQGRVPPMLGKHWSDETKQKISNSHKGKGIGSDNPNFGHHWTPEMKEKMSKDRIKNGTCAGGKNGRARAVICIETGVEYECATYASKELHCCRHQIVDCCLGKRETAKGYHWKYASQANTVPSSSEEEKV